MKTKSKKTNTLGGPPPEVWLLRRLDNTARLNIEPMSKKKIRRLLRNNLPNADEETYLIAPAVLIMRAADAFTKDIGSKSDIESDKAEEAALLMMQKQLTKVSEEAKKKLEEAEEQLLSDYFHHFADIIIEMYKIQMQAIRTTQQILR